MSDYQDKPVIEFPTSTAFDMKPVRVTMQFDSPKEIEKPSNYGDGMYKLYIYSVMRDGVEHTMFGYDGLNNALNRVGATTGTELDIICLGEGKDKKWDAKIISGPTATANSTPKAQTSDSRQGSSTYAPITAVDKDAIHFLMRERLALMEDAYSIVLSEFSHAEEFEQPQLLSVAHGLIISAERKFSRGMKIPELMPEIKQKENGVDKFVAIVKGAGEQTLSGILDGIVHANPSQTRETAIEAIKVVGIESGRDIDISDTRTWVRVLNIVTEFFNMMEQGVPIKDAVSYLRETYEIPVQESVF